MNLHSNRSIALCQSASDNLVAFCQVLLSYTWNCHDLDEVTFSAPYTWTSISGEIVWILCPCNWWDSLGNNSSTLAWIEFDIVCSWKIPFVLYHRYSVLSFAICDRFEWFCQLTSTKNSHNACTVPITMSLEGVAATTVVPSSLERSRIGV